MSPRDDVSNEVKVSNASEGMQLQPGSVEEVDYSSEIDIATDKKIIASCFWEKCDNEKAFTFWVLKKDGYDKITECSLQEKESMRGVLWNVLDIAKNCGEDNIVDQIMKDDTNITEVRCTAVDHETRKTTKLFHFPEHDNTCFKKGKANESWEKCKAANVRYIEVEKKNGVYWHFTCKNFFGFKSFGWFSGCAQDYVVDVIMKPDSSGYVRCY
jgi:hypothetical protein